LMVTSCDNIIRNEAALARQILKLCKQDVVKQSNQIVL
jgi:hypothetical protein